MVALTTPAAAAGPFKAAMGGLAGNLEGHANRPRSATQEAERVQDRQRMFRRRQAPESCPRPEPRATHETE